MAKFCGNCGALLQEGNAFCSSCGARVENNAAPQQAPVQQPVYTVQEPVYNVQEPVYNAQQSGYNAQQSGYVQQPANSLGMGWYKFIINFQIFASAIINILICFSAYNSLKEMDSYRGYLDALDKYIDSNQTCSMIVLVAFIGLAVFGFMVRGKLAGFKVDGPKQYLLYMGLIIAVQVIYLVVVYMLTNELQDAMGMEFDIGDSISSSIPSLAISVVMLFVNKVYFDKRKHLFVNA